MHFLLPKLLKRISRREAFSLMEILASVAIIAILAALIAPLAGRMTEQATRAKCVSNQRQVFLGVSSYATDHSSEVPSVRAAAQQEETYQGRIYNDETYGALLLLYPGYISDKRVFVCPSDKESNRRRWEADQMTGLYTSYFAYRDLDSNGDRVRRFIATDPNYAGRLPLFGDAARSNFHKTGYNVTFMDGHTEFVPAEMYQKAPYVNFFWE